MKTKNMLKYCSTRDKYKENSDHLRKLNNAFETLRECIKKADKKGISLYQKLRECEEELSIEELEVVECI